jgi:hypothetical protein
VQPGAWHRNSFSFGFTGELAVEESWGGGMGKERGREKGAGRCSRGDAISTSRDSMLYMYASSHVEESEVVGWLVLLHDS